MAIFVVLATIAGVVIVALTTSSGDSFEDAGSTDLGENCRPHEVRDQALESMGISGTHEHLDQYQSVTIGCKPHCGTWEYFSKGQNANGAYEYDPDASLGATIGGPDGAGGVYSSNTGCFAPCYWDYWFGTSPHRRSSPGVINNESSLSYYDDNRQPGQQQIRLGVNYRRETVETLATRPANHQMNRGSDLEHINQNKDGKPHINTRGGRGSRLGPGMLPLAPTQLEADVPSIFIPNFVSQGQDDPGGIARNGGGWEDENWEYRADPINRTCSIVNVTLDDQLVCSSEWDDCGGPS